MRNLMNFKTVMLIALVCLLVCGEALALNGPDFAPPFEVKGMERQDAKLAVKTFLDKRNGNKPTESASLVVGNKRVAVREFAKKDMNTKKDGAISIFLNEKPVFEFIFAGGFSTKDKKYTSFGQGYKVEDVSLENDKDAKTIKWAQQYPLPDGKKGRFTYQLKSLGKSKIELSWDIGATSRQIQQYKKQGHNIDSCTLYFSLPGIYGKKMIEVNGKVLESRPEAELKGNEGKKSTAWSGEVRKLVYDAANPLKSFTVTSRSGLKGVYTERYAYKRFRCGFMLNNNKPRGKLVLDFGKAAVEATDVPPPVEGHDLWKQDALHIPLSATRNMFPNPSFEQGLRYWRWLRGGGAYSRAKIRRYDVDTRNGRFGSCALVVNPTQHGGQAPRSFSLAGQKGKAYTVSYYARAEKKGATIKLYPHSSKAGGQFGRNPSGFKSEALTSKWQRFSWTFVSDGTPTALILSVSPSAGKIWLDGIQYEAGRKATPFVCAPLEGRLFTSHPDNNVEYGTKINAEFALSGKKGTTGSVDLALMDFFKNTVWEQTLSVRAGQRLKLPFDELHLATGTYILRARYAVGQAKPYYDYYRFPLIDSLKGTHATKDLYGDLFMARDHRAEDRLALMRRLGYGGSTSYGGGVLQDPLGYKLRKKFNVTDYTHSFMSCLHLTAEQKAKRHPDYKFLMSLNSRIWRRPEERKEIKVLDRYSPEVLKRFEKMAEKVAREHRYVRVWSIATEEEGTMPPLRLRSDFKEYAKLQMAFHRGIKRGNPKALVLPSGGTSGYGKVRGRADIEGYLSATQGKVKWDAIAIHPYGSVDGTLGAGDLDESIQMLIDSIAKFGYGEETPLYLNEGGGGAPCFWGDGPFYSYSGGQPTYDQGLHEFLHASKFARQYVICLKYWPRLAHFNTWQGKDRTVMDMNLTPSSHMLAVNTLGHVLAKPEFVSDIRPAPGMRGYAFSDDKGRGVAALWCTIDDVELGIVRGPVMRVKFDGPLPELIDLMGKSYKLEPESDGSVAFQLTPAPFFLRGGDPQKLAQALKNAEVVGAGTSIRVTFKPTLTGVVAAKVENLTGRDQSGKLVIDGKDMAFKVAGKQTNTLRLAGREAPEFGKMFRWNKAYDLVQPESEPQAGEWNMDYFYVPRVSGTPDWNRVPGFKMTNLYRPVWRKVQTPGGHKGDIAATVKAAWNEQNFYLRVEAEDDILNVDDPKFWGSSSARKNQLYMLDGCLEVYVDCMANGRLSKGGFDMDDYRYDFCVGNRAGKSGPGRVYRQQEVFMEYAGGVEFPSKEEAAKGIRCEFTRVSKKKYVYTITFAQKYLAPFTLEKGSVAGFGLYLHDRMDDGQMGRKGLSLATRSGVHANFNPHLWPLMILTDK